MVFGRIRVRVTSGLCPNTTYQFRHPFGTEMFTTNAAGGIPAERRHPGHRLRRPPAPAVRLHAGEREPGHRQRDERLPALGRRSHRPPRPATSVTAPRRTRSPAAPPATTSRSWTATATPSSMRPEHRRAPSSPSPASSPARWPRSPAPSTSAAWRSVRTSPTKTVTVTNLDKAAVTSRPAAHRHRDATRPCSPSPTGTDLCAGTPCSPVTRPARSVLSVQPDRTSGSAVGDAATWPPPAASTRR